MAPILPPPSLMEQRAAERKPAPVAWESESPGMLGRALEAGALPGPLAPLTTFLRMAHREQLPTVQNGHRIWDSNSRACRLATDALVWLTADATIRDQHMAEVNWCVAQLIRMSEDLKPVVAAKRQYEAALATWVKTLPVAVTR